MTEENKEIELRCPGGQCPIKISCETYEPDPEKLKGQSLFAPPFVQEGHLIKCSYLKLKKIVQEEKK